MQNVQMRFFLILVIVILQLRYFRCTHFTITPHEKDCFYFTAEKGNVIVGSYELIDANSSCIISIFDKKDKNLPPLFKSQENESKFELKANSTGIYAFCYQNKNSNDVNIIFSLRVKESVHDINEDDLSTVHDVQIINDITKQLYEEFLEVFDEQERMMEIAEMYKATNSKINSRLILWSEIQIVLLIILTLLHLYYIKSFFEIKTIV